MRLAGILLVLGFVLNGIGLSSVLLLEDIELKGDPELLVPEGPDSYAYAEVDMGGGGPVEGTFECLNGTAVRLTVMDEDQFSRFAEGLDTDSRLSVTGSSGEFSVDEVDMVVCYIVVEHFTGVEAAQTVRVDYVVTTTDFTAFLISITGIVGGGTMVILAFYSRQKAIERARAARKTAIDVVFFEE